MDGDQHEERLEADIPFRIGAGGLSRMTGDEINCRQIRREEGQMFKYLKVLTALSVGLATSNLL